VKYFIPEWNDRVDPKYDFIRDIHSIKHTQDPLSNDVYMWEIFGISNAPIDGILVSRITIENDKRKYRQTLSEGIHKVLRLPQNFEILGDCGAFGYVREKIPPFNPVEILDYYSKLGFNYGVSVDHLVVPQFKGDKEERMKITYENGVKAYEEWSRKFRDDFQLFLAIQGWDIPDYLKMYKNYIKIGATHLAFGGLARSITSFITRLIDELSAEIKWSKKSPEHLHFFGLARSALFPKFQELEDIGVEVSFDSASYLRKAWLSTPNSQLNYISTSGKGYTAIRIPFTGKIRRQKAEKSAFVGNLDILQLKNLEQESLRVLRLYDKGETNIEDVICVLSKLNKAIGETPELIEFYRKTLKDKPWKSCNCPICRELGIEVVLFRGNNRNRRRGFHNIYVFYNVFKNPNLWSSFLNRRDEKQESPLLMVKKGDRVLVITECTKQKLGYDSSVRTTAKEMYQGRLFKWIKRYCKIMEFDYVIISAKYGLVLPEEMIEGYEQVLRTEDDIKSIQSIVERKLAQLLRKYDKIIVIAGEKYRKVLHNLWDDRFMTVRSKGYGDLCRIVQKATPETEPLLKYIPSH
jgi:hypothetical protein